MILLAGGDSIRFNQDYTKCLAIFSGKTVIEHALDAIEYCSDVDYITIVSRKEDIDNIQKIILKNQYQKIYNIISGGNCRQESSYIGLKSLWNEYSNSDAKVLIHDAARPLVTCEIIERCVNALDIYNSVDTAIDVSDTIISTNNNFIVNIPERSSLMRGQTPQGFKYHSIINAYNKAIKDNAQLSDFTDDCGIVKKYLPDEIIYVIKGDETNIKITYPQDVFIADKLLQFRSISFNNNNFNKSKLQNKSLIIFGGNSGIGLEISKLAKSLNMNVLSFSRSLTNTDVGKYNDVEQAFIATQKITKHIDYVINATGLLCKKSLDQMLMSEITEQILTNYLGCINIAKCATKFINNGHILFFTSSSYTMGRKDYSVYSSTKAAIVNLTQALAEEYKTINTQINVVCPRRTNTPMRHKNFGEEPTETLLDPKQVAEVTLQTLTTPYSGKIIQI
jgi:2-C-methyl-D-erythritol 4-phosphate cytidylyltransferase